VPVSSQETERSCICELRAIDFGSFNDFLLDSVTVPTVWYFLFFNLLYQYAHHTVMKYEI